MTCTTGGKFNRIMHLRKLLLPRGGNRRMAGAKPAATVARVPLRSPALYSYPRRDGG